MLSLSKPTLIASAYSPAVYGAMHAIVDAACAVAIFSSTHALALPVSYAFYIVVGYDLLAFGSQFAFGLAADTLGAPRAAIFIGIAATAMALVTADYEPIATMILAGVGNSLFHIGAGAFSLYTRFGRATPAGIFVAPGALGLAFGSWMGKSGSTLVWPFITALLLCMIVSTAIDNPRSPYREQVRELNLSRPYLILSLLLISVLIRSFVGFAGCYECPKIKVISIGMPIAAFAGKAFGGVISDRLGWVTTSVSALLISAPLIAFGTPFPFAVVGGMLLFQMTMPVTLTATAHLFPKKPAFAFGLPCLALIAGSLPTFFNPVKHYYNHQIIFVLILFSAAAVFVALRLFQGAVPMKFPSRLAAIKPSEGTTAFHSHN